MSRQKRLVLRSKCPHPDGKHVFPNYENGCVGLTREAFCEGMFHVYPHDNHLHHFCLRKEKTQRCDHKESRLLVEFQEYVAGYTRCGGVHAEMYMVQDEHLWRYLISTPPFLNERPTFHMWQKRQPCHHSGMGSDLRSCTDLVLMFYKQWLKPRNIQLVIHVSCLYRVQDQEPSEAKTSAINGIHLLLKEGIVLRAIREQEWLRLATYVREEDFDPHEIAHPSRHSLNNYVDQFLLREAVRVGSPAKLEVEVEDESTLSQ